MNSSTKRRESFCAIAGLASSAVMSISRVPGRTLTETFAARICSSRASEASGGMLRRKAGSFASCGWCASRSMSAGLDRFCSIVLTTSSLRSSGRRSSGLMNRCWSGSTSTVVMPTKIFSLRATKRTAPPIARTVISAMSHALSRIACITDLASIGSEKLRGLSVESSMQCTSAYQPGVVIFVEKHGRPTGRRAEETFVDPGRSGVPETRKAMRIVPIDETGSIISIFTRVNKNVSGVCEPRQSLCRASKMGSSPQEPGRLFKSLRPLSSFAAFKPKTNQRGAGNACATQTGPDNVVRFRMRRGRASCAPRPHDPFANS